MTPLRVAIWQCAPTTGDVDANLARLDQVAARAAASGAGLLITPELALTGYDVGAVEGQIRDEDVDRVGEIADKHSIAVVTGLALRADGMTWNAAVAFDESGVLLGTYRKAHLFGDLDLARFGSGDEPFTLVRIGDLRVALMICYDVEFPETVRAAALAGATLVAVPTANMYPLEIVNELVVRVRAWENQLYLAYANHCGSEGATRYVGRSSISGPDGVVLAGAGPDGEELLMADVDPDVVARARSTNTYLTDRRPELYHGLVEQHR